MLMNNKQNIDNIINFNKHLSKDSMINNSENSNNENAKKNKDELLIRKNQSNNCNINNRNLYIKKLVFNPISDEYQKKIKSSLLLNKNHSTMNLGIKKKLPPLNINRPLFSRNKNENSIFKNNSQNFEKNSKNNLSDTSRDKNYYNNKLIKPRNLNIKIIDFISRYKNRKKEEKKIKNKNIYKDKHIQDFKKSILDLYNKVEETKRKYLNNANFIHHFLFNTDRSFNPYHESLSAQNKNLKDIISYNYNIKIQPKFEYVDYCGKENKVITRLTSSVNGIRSENGNNEMVKNLKLNRQLKAPKLIALKDSEDYKNKNFIKILQKKKKKQRIEEAKRIRENKKMKNIIQISKKGFEMLQNNKNKNFSGLIKYTIKEHKSVIKKLNDMIEIDKEQYEKNFNEINTKINDL